MAKTVRIKRRSEKKRAKGFGLVRIALYIGLLAAVFFFGWSIYTPLRAYIKGEISISEPDSSHASRPESSASSPEQSAPEQSSESSDPGQDVSSVRAVYLPAEALLDTGSLAEKLDDLREKGFNAVMIDLKDEEGCVMYSSEVALAKKSLTETPFDLSAAVGAIKGAGLEVIGRMYSFHDHMGGRALRAMGIYYMDQSFLWLDDYPEKGGRSWLNPYSEEAMTYLTELTSEAAENGVSKIILTGFCFPPKIGIETANFGENAKNISFQEMLKKDLEALAATASEKGSEVYFFAEGTAVMGGDDYLYRGAPLNIADKTFSASLFPSDIVVSKLSEKLGLAENASAYDLTAAQTAAVLEQLRGNMTFLPMIQGFSDNWFACGQNEILSQINALSDAGINSYIVYSPSGNYPAVK